MSQLDLTPGPEYNIAGLGLSLFIDFRRYLSNFAQDWTQNYNFESQTMIHVQRCLGYMYGVLISREIDLNENT